MSITAKRQFTILTVALGCALLWLALSSHAAKADTDCFNNPVAGFGVEAGCFDGAVNDSAGNAFTQAAGHPFSAITRFDINTRENPNVEPPFDWPSEPLRDAFVDLPAGFIGNPTAVGECSLAELVGTVESGQLPVCPVSSQVGSYILRANFRFPFETANSAVYSMQPPPGSAARFGFNAFGTIVVLDAELRRDGDYGLTVASRNISEGIALTGFTLDIWGVPADEAHDPQRFCPGVGMGCESDAALTPFLRNPTACTPDGEGLITTIRIDSRFDPGDFHSTSFESHLPPGRTLTPVFPFEPALTPAEWGEPQGPDGCEDVEVKGTLEAKPTTPQAETSSGLDVRLSVPNPGLTHPTAISASDIKKVKVALPQGVTVNPSQAEGLGVCTPAQYESTELSFFPTLGKGCPDDSKIGSVLVETPLLEEKVPGDVFIAEPFDNPEGSLLALYIVLHNPDRGILVKLSGKVETDEQSGQITTTFDDLPQLPFSSFDFKFREGARAPLVTPPACGEYTTTTEIWGHSDPDGPPIVSESTFAIDRGIGGGPCPSGVPGFNPGFTAGAINNNAGSFSPVNMRLTRLDGEQNLTKFSATLPPGLLAKLAGVEQCPEAAITAAKSKTGKQELASPSCPLGSQIGTTKAGAGVGSVLTYVPGKLYLAGPFNGAPLSIVSITPAVAGPFDVGTVVVREALRIDPATAQATADGAASDPIPHILKGIPLKLRDLRVYVDRDQFTLNPTGCDPDQVLGTMWGSPSDVFNPADDLPVARSARFQAANCLNLGFRPHLNLRLFGGTERGAHPKLRAVLRMPQENQANIARTAVTLPRSAFLDQGHLNNVCTRVRFAEDNCPKGSIYGRAVAHTPLLDEPLRGPVYLRSSSNKLPDLVADLHGQIEIELVGRIDSVRGGIRTTFDVVPDAPVSKFVLTMQGGAKGLIVNSTDLCSGRHRATVKMDAHNGKIRDFNPVLRADCGKGGKRKRVAQRSVVR